MSRRLKDQREIGPSEVGATIGANLGRPLFLENCYFFFLPLLLKTPEGVVVEFQICAWAPK
jgi:hypothetical protein